MSTEQVLPNPEAQVVGSALQYISTRLGTRLEPLAHSTRVLDVIEAANALVYILSSASSLAYVSRAARLRSFQQAGWETCGRAQSAEGMVESGFFCLGEDDHVKCFFCDLGLKDWQPGDSPELEHAKFSPLCFYLKASRGLDWLRQANQRPPDFPSSYARQDHNRLLELLAKEARGPAADMVCKLGFSPTKVLLCLARQFIRFRKSLTTIELLAEMQAAWDREMSENHESAGQQQQFTDEFDVATVLTCLCGKFPANSQPAAAAAAADVRRTPGSATVERGRGSKNNKCRSCGNRQLEIVCLPCGHLSLCTVCCERARVCPAVGCGCQVDCMVRAFVS